MGDYGIARFVGAIYVPVQRYHYPINKSLRFYSNCRTVASNGKMPVWRSHSNGARKLQPSFQREQPKAVLPRITVPFPHNGQASPSFTVLLGVADFAALFSFGLRCAGDLAVLGLAGEAVHVTRLTFCSAITEATIWLTIFFSSSMNCVAEYSPRSISRSFFSHWAARW